MEKCTPGNLGYPRFAAAALLAVAVIISSGCISGGVPGVGGNTTIPCNGTDKLVQPGDTVTVEYTSRHVTGKIIESGEFTFISMAGQARKGFDEAVEGMCLGGVKHVSVPPEKAYGLWDPSLATAVPVQSETNRTFTVTVEEFRERFGKNPVVGVMYTDEELAYPVRVGSVSGTQITLEKAVTAGYRIEAGKAEPWPIDVVKVTAGIITLFRNVTDGTQVSTVAGKRNVTVANGTITVDLNHPLAGETILYDIEVISLEKD